MRICIDASSLLVRSAGVKNYVWHWMHAVSAAMPNNAVTAFPLLRQPGALNHERSLYSTAYTLPRLVLLKLANLGIPGLMDAIIGRADVFHASNLVRSLPNRGKLTATLYDMTAVLMPELHTAATRSAEAVFQEHILRHADGVIAISEASKWDAVRMLRLDERKVEVIYPGIDLRFFDAKPATRAKPYLLYLGTIEPRKNVDTLLDAWTSMPSEFFDTYDLLLGGATGWASERTLTRLAAGVRGARYLGYVPESELPGLVAGATVFVYPSLYEGFGFPLAQAMAAGRACVTSNVSSLPEVAGDSALLVDPKSPSEIRNAILRLVESELLRNELGNKARERAEQFTWTAAGLASAEFFTRICGQAS